MNIVNKFLTSTIIVLLLSSLLMFQLNPTNVQAIANPPVPQFTVKLVDYSYDIPPTSSTYIDQYTGKEITTTTPGRHVPDKRIEVTIKNSPFTPSTADNGQKRELRYNVQVKGHFGEDWQAWGAQATRSDSQYTVVSGSANGYAAGAILDFRVEAVIGHMYDPMPDRLIFMLIFATDASSGWSSPQTFTIPSETTPIPTPTINPSTNPTTTPNYNQTQPVQPQIPDFIYHPLFLLGIGALFAGIVVLVVMTFTKRHLKTECNNDFFTN